MNMLSRRMFAQAAAGAAALLPSAAQEIAKTIAAQPNLAALKGNLGGIDISAAEKIPIDPRNITQSIPMMAQDAAKKLIMKQLLEEGAFEDEARRVFNANMRSSLFFDEDINNKRSWSQAAKIAFQRQRMVSRNAERVANETMYNRNSDNIYWKVQQRLRKLMWGDEDGGQSSN